MAWIFNIGSLSGPFKRTVRKFGFPPTNLVKMTVPNSDAMLFTIERIE
jgi:hypothetical protein